MILEALLIATAIVLAGVTVDSILLRIRRRKLINDLVSLTIENMKLLEEVNQANMSPSESDGFIKFLSDSREWAFTYIEDVQKAIEDLKNAMNKDSEVDIAETYNRLIQFLPEKMNND